MSEDLIHILKVSSFLSLTVVPAAVMFEQIIIYCAWDLAALLFCHAFHQVTSV